MGLECSEDGTDSTCKTLLDLETFGKTTNLVSYSFPSIEVTKKYTYGYEIPIEFKFPIAGYGITLNVGINFDANAYFELTLAIDPLNYNFGAAVGVKFAIEAYAEIDFGSVLKAGVRFTGTLVDA